MNEARRTENREQLKKAFANLIDQAEGKTFCSANLEFKVKDGNIVHFDTSIKQSHKVT